MGARLKDMLHEICTAYKWAVEALEVMDDPVHLFVGCPLRWAPAEAVNLLKSLTARALFEEFRPAAQGPMGRQPLGRRLLRGFVGRTRDLRPHPTL